MQGKAPKRKKRPAPIPVRGPWPTTAGVARRLGVDAADARRIAERARAAVGSTAAPPAPGERTASHARVRGGAKRRKH